MTDRLLSLHDAALHPAARERGVTQHHLRDACLRGALKRKQDDLTTGRFNNRTVYAVTEAALLEFLDAEPQRRAERLEKAKIHFEHAKTKAVVSAERRRERLLKLKQELIKESRLYDMTLDQYLDLIDAEPKLRSALATLGQTAYPSQYNKEQHDDPREDLNEGDESDAEESLLCSEEPGSFDADAFCLGDVRGLAD